MRSCVIVVSIVFAAACGGAADDPSPLFGGFAPTTTAVVVFAPDVCTPPLLGDTVSVSGVGIVFADLGDACEVQRQTSYCGERASSTSINLLALRGVPGTGGIEPVDAGTYPYLGTEPTGPFRGVGGYARRNDAACDAIGESLSLRAGSVTLSTVEADRVAGSVDLLFEGNQRFQATFDATVCTTQIELSTRMEDCGWTVPPACVPAP